MKNLEIVKENDIVYAQATLISDKGQVIITKQPCKDEDEALEYFIKAKSQLQEKKQKLEESLNNIKVELDAVKLDIEQINALIKNK